MKSADELILILIAEAPVAGNTSVSANVPRQLPAGTGRGPANQAVHPPASNRRRSGGAGNPNGGQLSADSSSPTLSSVTQAFLNLRSYFQDYYNHRATSTINAPSSNITSANFSSSLNNTQRLLALRRIRLARELRESGTVSLDIPSQPSESNRHQRRRLSGDSNSDGSSDASPDFTWSRPGDLRRFLLAGEYGTRSDSDEDSSDEIPVIDGPHPDPRRNSSSSTDSSTSVESAGSFSMTAPPARSLRPPNVPAIRSGHGFSNSSRSHHHGRPRAEHGDSPSVQAIFEQHYRAQSQSHPPQAQTQSQTNNHHFRYKIVCLLTCRSCGQELCNRGMKAILLADTKVELYSTDCPPLR